MQRNRTLAALLAACLLALPAARANAADPAAGAESARPAWAKLENQAGAVPGTMVLDRLGLVLARSPARQRAYDAYLNALQDPASPDYQRWLVSDEIGARFGADEDDLAAVSQWLAGQGLRVESVSPTRRIVRFSGRVADVERAFATRLHLYEVAGNKRMAPLAPAGVPAAIADKVERIDGLETLRLEPTLHGVARRDSGRLPGAPGPKASSCDASGICEHYIFPGDFAVLYDLESAHDSGYDGEGQSIAIVARTRVHAEDIVQFRARAALPAMDFDTVIAQDGSDPGPAADSCGDTGEPDCEDPDDATLDQGEATMDVALAAGAAPGARIKLVTSDETDGVDGVLLALEHAVYAEPPPARIISISYSTCEADNSAGAAAYLDEVFADAAMQGISVFVASGDSGAGDCSPHHAPPDGDRRLSVNLLCSSPHVTCVGGTEFDDGDEDAGYWSTSNGPGYTSALGRIPERGWNQPLDADGEAQLAASGGGVSQRFDTPDWQVGPGVPAAREGRYLPDVALNASSHTGYFYCMAAFDASCAPSASGSFRFLIGAGTSASAPSMAGIGALVNQRMGKAQGNLNPRLYAIAGNGANEAVRDVAGDGAACDLGTPSTCNNSTPGAAGEPALEGYAIGPGYDLVTGLGSPSAARLLDAWANPASSGVRINQRGISGSWANPATDSQGFVLEVVPDLFGAHAGNLFAGWFTFEDDGTHRWYTLQGEVTDVAEATLPIYETTGGRLDSAQATTTRRVGTAHLVMESCTRARLSYLFEDTSRGGEIPLQRLLANVDCAEQATPPATPADARYAGTWADHGNSGQGLVLDVAPSQAQLFGAWYTFAATAAAGSDAESQRWVTLQAGFPAGARELTAIGIYESSGGRFDRPADTETVQVGAADLEFVSCSHATLDYRFTSGTFAGREGRLDLQRVTAIPAGCE